MTSTIEIRRLEIDEATAPSETLLQLWDLITAGRGADFDAITAMIRSDEALMAGCWASTGIVGLACGAMNLAPWGRDFMVHGVAVLPELDNCTAAERALMDWLVAFAQEAGAQYVTVNASPTSRLHTDNQNQGFRTNTRLWPSSLALVAPDSDI